MQFEYDNIISSKSKLHDQFQKFSSAADDFS